MEDSMDNQNSISNNSSNSVASSNPFDSFKMNGKYVELSPENDLKFTEVDQSNPQIHSSTTIIAQSSLTIKNVENFAVLFKIQTTSPLHYRVKPSHGRIEAGETKDINISMSSDSKKTDKFLINIVPTFESWEETSLEFNSQFNMVPEEFTQKYRLRCLTGNSNLLSASGGGNGSVGNISSPVAPTIPLNGAESMASITSSIDEKPSSLKDNFNGSANAISSPAPSGLSVSSSTSVATLQRELKEARSEIDRLKLLLKKGADWKNMLSAQYGAPPVLVILVAIFAFMLGLLF